MGSDNIAAAIRAARNDDKVRAVVFRVDSPGGSYVASDTVWREVAADRATRANRSSSRWARWPAPGGYFISCPADVIVAQPSTLTGSIGVFGGKVVITQLMDKVGLASDAVSRGAHSRMFSTRAPVHQRGAREAGRDARRRSTPTSSRKVAEGRGMTRDAVHEIAKGRVWTGADAARNGLVDSLGGVREAAAIARDARRSAGRRAATTGGARRVAGESCAHRSPATTRGRSSMTSNGWGDLAGIAASLGLPAAGPLMMPDLRLT